MLQNLSLNYNQNTQESDEKARVAVYARVSTEHEEQIYALSNQIQYYKDIVKSQANWELSELYIDEGITGTSAKKRSQFIQMMKDAKEHKFDMLITREVSRFARNTIDTLHYTRELKKLGIQVFFIMDNINTFDKDGELRLTIMASLAQEESRKISERVKSGQRKSMEKGVAYGTGNIIGYDKVDGKYIINKEQFKTVKLIYEMYLEGNGARLIKFELEKRGYKNSKGTSEWWYTTILRILQNPFYCGRVVMRKQVVLDFLEQKRTKNNNDSEKVFRTGIHETIVSEEDFDKVQKILKQKTQIFQPDKSVIGKKDNKYLWSGKIVCGNCDSIYKRTNWHKLKDGTRIYAYWCSLRAKNGTSKNREYYNSPMENTCDSVAIPEWKFDNMAKFILCKLIENKDQTIQILKDSIKSFATNIDYTDEILDIKKNIDKYQKKIDNLIEMKTDGDITKEEFLIKRKEFDDFRNNQIKLLDKYEYKSQEIVNTELRINKLMEFFNSDINFELPKLPDDIIDLIVKQVIVYDNKKFKFILISDIENQIDLDEFDLNSPICTPPYRLLWTNEGIWDKNSTIYCGTYTMRYTDVSYIVGNPSLKNQWWEDVEIEVCFI